ncbi:hypothetical protein [Ornithinimicrobium faecis]|nr:MULTISPECIES: hypothetical protein [unclassified Ornithinimicrobium]
MTELNKPEELHFLQEAHVGVLAVATDVAARHWRATCSLPRNT